VLVKDNLKERINRIIQLDKPSSPFATHLQDRLILPFFRVFLLAPDKETLELPRPANFSYTIRSSGTSAILTIVSVDSTPHLTLNALMEYKDLSVYLEREIIYLCDVVFKTHRLEYSTNQLKSEYDISCRKLQVLSGPEYDAIPRLQYRQEATKGIM
jgi:hypothetical protein